MTVCGGLLSFEKQEPIHAAATTVPSNVAKANMNPSKSWHAELALAQAAGLEAYRLIAQANELQVSHKGRADLVTQVDLQSEAIIRKHLSTALPAVPILGEEEGGERHPTQWIVDPLDGTTNFVHGFPAYAVSIALMVDSEVRVGCIINAANGEIYTASQGGGAYLNDQRLQVSQVKNLENALLLTGFPYDRHQKARF